MADSLMFESKKKSQKPALDKQRVAKIFRMIEEKFKDDKNTVKIGILNYLYKRPIRSVEMPENATASKLKLRNQNFILEQHY